MRQYARWAATARGSDPEPVTADDFYDDPHAQSLFRNFLGVLMSRVNTLTGVAYKCAPLFDPHPCRGSQCVDDARFETDELNAS